MLCMLYLLYYIVIFKVAASVCISRCVMYALFFGWKNFINIKNSAKKK